MSDPTPKQKIENNYEAIHEWIGVAKDAIFNNTLSPGEAERCVNALSAMAIRIARLSGSCPDDLNDAVFGAFLAILNGTEGKTE